MKKVYVTAAMILVGFLVSTIIALQPQAQPQVQPQAQNDNLLLNPGFEGIYTAQDGISEVRVAPYWRAYWKENLICLPDWLVPGGSPAQFVKRPEYRYAGLPLDERRVRSGQKSQLAFVTYGVNLAGVYQQSPELTGRPTVQAGVWAQSWSSAENDPTQNVGGDMFATVCIDPAGQMDPWARRVQCSEWQGVPPSGADGTFAYIQSPQVQAQRERVTVFVLWMGRWAVRHNDIYLDDAQLMVVGAEQPTVTPCPTCAPCPSVTPCPTGQPGDCASVEDMQTVIAEWDRR